MITVSIAINDQVIFTRSAVRREGSTDPDSMNMYVVDTGDIIKHKYGDGAVPLAIEMLKTIDDKFEVKR